MNSETDESLIRGIVENWAKACCQKSVDGLVANHADDILLFDLKAPLQHSGMAAYRRVWEECLPYMTEPLKVELRDLKVTSNGNVAFSHSLHHMTTGENDTWMRATLCYRKEEEQWLVAHAHVSVPIDMESNQPAWNLKPE